MGEDSNMGGRVVGVNERGGMLVWAKARPLQQEFKEIGVVPGSFALPKGERVKQCKAERNGRRYCCSRQGPAPDAEKEQESNYPSESSPNQEPEKVSLQTPSLPGRIILAIGFGEAPFPV